MMLEKTIDKVFIDTAPYIYALEDNPVFSDITRVLISQYYENNCDFVTSAVTYMEFCTMPYKLNMIDKVIEFESFISETGTFVVSINTETSKLAAKIRAKYSAIKGLDALQVACAIYTNCNIFLTNDKQLKQVTELNVVVIDDII